jgi:hypothetical protein
MWAQHLAVLSLSCGIIKMRLPHSFNEAPAKGKKINAPSCTEALYGSTLTKASQLKFQPKP